MKEFNVSWKESLYFSRIVGHTKILHEENRIFFCENHKKYANKRLKYKWNFLY